MSHSIHSVLQRLSAREREVLTHLAEGHTYAAIAHRMNVSPHTVDTYLRRIRGKTGARSRMHLLLLAMGLAAPGTPHPAADLAGPEAMAPVAPMAPVRGEHRHGDEEFISCRPTPPSASYEESRSAYRRAYVDDGAYLPAVDRLAYERASEIGPRGEPT